MSELKKPGPPKRKIPDYIVEALEETYMEGIPNSITMPEHIQQEFIQISNLYAKHAGKSFRYKISSDGQNISYQLTDKRKYTKSTLEREN